MTAPLTLKPTDWPELDRELWARAQRPAGFLKASRPASSWSAKRRRIVEQAYGQWLAWLLRTDRLDFEQLPGSRATPDLVQAFVEQLHTRVAPQSVSMMLGGLQRMLQVIDPDQDWGWLRRMYADAKAGAKPTRSKFANAVPPKQLYRLGLQLMNVDDLAKRPRPYQSTRYRDGLMIAVLISCPIRISNLEQVEIGRQLLFEGNRYWLDFSAEDTKTGKAFQGDLPSALTPWIDRYLDAHRPSLISLGDGDATRRLWIDRWGRPMAEHSIRAQINKRTRAALGRNVWPHLFRHCAVTGLVDLAPEDIAIAPDLLGHATMQTTQKHYILARGTRAHQAVQGNLAEARRRARERLRSRTGPHRHDD